MAVHKLSLLRKFSDTLSKRTIPYIPQFRNMSYALVYKEYGDPESVIKKEEVRLKELGPNEVLIKMLAAPVNPADINMIQGTYAIRPSFPAIGGNEGVGEVTKVGPEVKSLKIGSWVLPIMAGWGTWRTHAVDAESNFIEVDNSIPVLSAATIAVNPCTAYRMLKEFEQLKPGDTIIQNGANSGVGQAAIQIAKQQGIHTINVVRKRPNFDEIKTYLISLGADFVLTEEEVRSKSVQEVFKKVPKPKLALNCVGGKSSSDIMRHLSFQGTIVTYGGMSREPVTVATSALIFKDIKVRGYWMSRWSENNARSPERTAMMKDICEMIKSGKLKLPICNTVPFEDFSHAISDAMKPFSTKKQILVMESNASKE